MHDPSPSQLSEKIGGHIDFTRQMFGDNRPTVPAGMIPDGNFAAVRFFAPCGQSDHILCCQKAQTSPFSRCLPPTTKSFNARLISRHFGPSIGRDSFHADGVHRANCLAQAATVTLFRPGPVSPTTVWADVTAVSAIVSPIIVVQTNFFINAKCSHTVCFAADRPLSCRIIALLPASDRIRAICGE